MEPIPFHRRLNYCIAATWLGIISILIQEPSDAVSLTMVWVPHGPHQKLLQIQNHSSYLNNKQSSNSINSWQLLPHWHISWCTWHVLYIQVQLHGMMYNYTRNYTHNYTRMMYMARSRDPDRLHYTHNVYIVHTKCILHTTCHVYRASLTPPTNHHWHLNRIRIIFTAQPQT